MLVGKFVRYCSPPETSMGAAHGVRKRRRITGKKKIINKCSDVRSG